jgi:perosamine synthetase
MGRIWKDEIGLNYVEDSCEAFGSRLDDKFAGTFGRMGTFSFFPSHTISTGEGGAIVTDDKALAEHCRALRNHGRKESSDPMDKFSFEYFGFNAKMSSMQAVIGIALMSHIWEYLDQRRRVFKWLQRGLGGFVEAEDEEIIPHGYPVLFASETARDNAMRNILEAGIECRKFFSCIPCSEMPYKEYGDKFPVADHIGRTHLYLPAHQNLGREDCEYMIQVVKEQEGLVK